MAFALGGFLCSISGNLLTRQDFPDKKVAAFSDISLSLFPSDNSTLFAKMENMPILQRPRKFLSVTVFGEGFNGENQPKRRKSGGFQANHRGSGAD